MEKTARSLPFLVPVPTSFKGSSQETLPTAATGRVLQLFGTHWEETDAKARCWHEDRRPRA